jgi:DNA-binding NarL/FixJ family response regulator
MTSVLLVEPQSQRRGERQMTHVLLVEDHAAFREALTTLLNMQPDVEVVGRAGSLAEGRAALALEEVDVAVVDVFLPDGNGVELVRELRQADPRLPIVILTAGLDPELHTLAFEAGADEVCLKAEGIEEILKAIRGVAADR